MAIQLINPTRKRRRRRTTKTAKRRRVTRRRNAPATRKRKTKRKPPKGFRTWSAYMAHIRPGGKKKRRKAKRRRATARRNPTRRRRRTTRSRPVARRRRRRASARRRAPRRRRRTYRRNPTRRRAGLRIPTAKTAIDRLMQGGIGALQVTIGKAGARIAAQMIPLPQLQGTLAGQAITALVVGMVADMVAPRDVAKNIVIGALQAPIEAAVVGFNVPFIGPALASYPMASYPMASYPTAGYLSQPSGMSAYPQETDQVSLMQGYS